MATLTLDTLNITNKLKSRGYSEDQAIGFVETLQEMDLDHLVTKADLKADLNNAVSGLRIEMRDMKNDIFKWMFGGFLTIAIMILGVMVQVSL